MIFTMAQPNRFAYEYAVKNRGSSDLTVIDLYYLRHDDNEFMDDSSYGYVTESDEFPRLYIPPEHTAERLDEIQCYRMLPYRNAWESELDPSVFFGFNENRGDAPRITKERAMEICYESSSFLEAAQKLLEEGDYSRGSKRVRKGLVSGIYWAVVVALYLGYSFVTFRWDRSWIIWPIAAVLYAVVIKIEEAVYNGKNNK